MELSEYDFEIHHLPGRLNGRADALSRRPGYDQGEDDNKDVVVLPNHVFVRAGRMECAPPMQRIMAQEEMEASDPVYAQDEGTLKPWIDAHQLKKIASSKTLCQGLPAPFVAFTQYIQSLGFDEKLQYDYLHTLLMQCSAHGSNNVVLNPITISPSFSKLAPPAKCSPPRSGRM